MKKFNVLGVVAFLIVTLAIPGMAQDGKGGKSGKMGSETITEVDVEGKTITTSTKTHTISENATIKINGEDGKTLADLKPGMMVKITGDPATAVQAMDKKTGGWR